ncbi:AraC family transcriptional regulator [Azorhizobium oxalatiphilum]|uniref:AraC family transcriptional regulator n=1 Tax=Azorhizobium oxalatiphilum TaxID=980631 RepID=A0A917BGT2_9HYPH|nr:DUF1465 family protein [Azorhizobium oxalatiphilum]GGF44542.1 AraC family transcriptional regulator [Azorhizobium oxalatiphilum]
MTASAHPGTGPFAALYSDGLDLAARLSAYLSGPGKAHAESLPLEARLAYHDEARELTTLLLQLAAWLLMERAVAEGEMTVDHACHEAEELELRPRRAVGPLGIPDGLKALRAEAELLRLRVIARAEHLLAMGERPPENQVAAPRLRPGTPHLRIVSDSDDRPSAP